LIVGTTLLAVAFGGATALWSQAVIALLAAVTILLFPPRRMPGAMPSILLGLFMSLALAAFLPADWCPVPDWRRHLTNDLHVPLGLFRTPQPWLTLQWCALLFLGLVWTAYLLSQEWSNAEKSQVLHLLVAGVIFLAAVAIVAYLTGHRIPGWNQEQNRGWFPNRNQSANVLAIIGVVNYAIALRCLQRKQGTLVFWTLGLAVICIALVICYSRAGILLFFLGLGTWHFIALFRPQKLNNFAVGGTVLLVLLSLFFLFGGTTLERFLKVSEASGSSRDDFRVLVQEDAALVSLHSPILGVGLGNFEPVFTAMRQVSADQNRTLHPESDWLWMAVEMGWLAPLLVLIGLRWWLGECLPLELKQGESLRRAALVASMMFLLHGFVDVAGHRLGSVFVGLLLMSTALAPKLRNAASFSSVSLFRIFAAVLGLIGTWWMASVCANEGPPTTATLAGLQARIDEEASKGRLASMCETVNAALALQPLNWTYYFRRGSAEAFRNGGTEAAENDFAVAQFLEPHSIDLCLFIGTVWLDANEPGRCLDAWHEALQRAGSRGNLIYKTALTLSQNNPEVHRGLEQLVTTNTDYLILFLDFGTPDEEKDVLDSLLIRDPNLQTLNSEQQRKLFTAWYARGNQEDLANLLLIHAQLQITGWKYLARNFGQKKEFEMASMIALRHLPPPTLQPAAPDPATTPAANHFNNHPDDVIEGIRLCQSQIQANDLDEALLTIEKLERLKDCPRYIFYLKAKLYVKKQMWEQAWNALQQLDGV